MIGLAILFSLLALIIPLRVLFLQNEASLQEGTFVHDPAKLLAWRNQIVTDLVRLKADYDQQAISEKSWQQKKDVLVGRYISVEQRRLFVLQQQAQGGKSS